MLVFHGIEATGVEDGAEGCKIGLAENFDTMIIDIMLPSLDGLSICQKIRAQKPAQGIILLTAKGSEEDIVKGFQAGADDYVSKTLFAAGIHVRLEEFCDAPEKIRR